MSAPLTRDDPSVIAGLELVGIVRECGPDTVNEFLEDNARDLEDICVALAAMVDDTKTPRELLDWLHPKKYKQAMSQRVWAMAQPPKPKPKLPPRVYGPRVLTPCGTHAAYARHRSRGEAVCGPCGVEEKRYQRDRKRVERAA